ncbi:MAG TPA: nicotinate-nucleotide--dimethylbenzimidazole phosphoribosyltransferase [Pirellulales bacterium]|nr:nicotinate-nucleotide--dimethylbenzimidazole phosphoribosyltransferase [Pirellulales bacterium]
MLAETIRRIGPLDDAAMSAALARLNALAKPPGSLGRLEELAMQLAGISGRVPPPLEKRVIYVFAADHGVTAERVSAYPSVVTAQMVSNFLRGGAAINVLARQAGATLVVVDVGIAGEVEAHPRLVSRKVARGTRNFAREPAMSREEAVRAVEIGISVFEPCQLAGMGEMGIGNTTAAAAIVAAATGRSAAEVAGLGTGLDPAGLKRKIDVIERALARHRPDRRDGFSLLQTVGGFEIGALAGAMLAGAAARVPVVIDGFISTAAAIVATRLCPAVRPYLIAAHGSAERGHPLALAEMGLRPFLNLDLRLGEGTGAALAFHLIDAACRVTREMATFEEADVCGKR